MIWINQAPGCVFLTSESLGCSHAGGMRSLSPQLEFCSNGKTIYGGGSGSAKVVAAVIAEMAALFADELFHVGGDETLTMGNCTMESFTSFEKAVVDSVRAAGKVPMGWEEMFTDTKAAAAGSNFVLSTWSKFNAVSAAAAGFDAVECASGRFYIQDPIKYDRLWFDIGHNHTSPDDRSSKAQASTAAGAVIGGEVSLWGNPWCVCTPLLQ